MTLPMPPELHPDTHARSSEITDEISMLGAVVLWKLAQFDRQKIQYALKAMGLSKYIPKEKTNREALKQALKRRAFVLTDTHQEVMVINPETHKKQQSANGKRYELVSVQRSSQENTYQTVYSVMIPKSGEQELHLIKPGVLANNNVGQQAIGSWWQEELLLKDLYNKEKTVLEAAPVGSALSDICVYEFEGTVIRPSGGVYWIPNRHLVDWKRLMDSIPGCTVPGGEAKLFSLGVRRDKDAVIAVTAGIVKEIETNCAELTSSINEGDLGERALNNRQKQAIEMKKKIDTYERLLRHPLDHLKTKCDSMKAVAAEALLSKLS